MRLRDLASFVRSKTAGPFMATFDVMFTSQEDLDRAWSSGAFEPEKIAKLYPGLTADDIMVFNVPPALAIKVSLPRRVQSGAVGDTDIAAGQQFAPLLDLDLGEAA